MLNRDDYKAALARLTGVELQKAVRVVNEELLTLARFENTQEKINDWIDNYPGAKLKGIRKSGTYLKFYSSNEAIRRKAGINRPAGQQNAIQYLLLFYDDQKLQLRCTPGIDGYDVYKTSAGEFEIPDPNHDESVIYDVFYWRTTTDEVGVAKIRFYDNWQQAELVYHYRTVSKGQAFLKGPVQRYGENVYIDLTDTHVPVGASPIRSFWSLFVSPDADKRNYIAGVFASSNRDNHEPICGKLMLRQNTEDRDLSHSKFLGSPPPGGSERILQHIPDDIFYVLTNTRLKVLAKPILGDRTIPYHAEVESLKAFAGTYQVYQPWRNATLNLTRLTISENGQVVLTSNNNMKDTVGFVVYCDKTLIIRFAYDADADYHRFYSMLEKVSDSRNLTGIHAGLTEGKELVSGRVYLSRRDDDDLIRSERVPTPSQSYFDSLRHTDPDAFRFLTNREPGSVDTRWMSHLDSLSGVRPKLESTPPPAYMAGTYNAFFLTKLELKLPPHSADLDDRTLLPEQPIQLIQMPLSVRDGRVFATHGTRQIEGTVQYDGMNQLMVQFDNPMLSIILSVPVPNSDQATENQHYYGVLSRIDKEPEASALIVHRESDSASLLYRRVDRLSELLLIEQRHTGLVSFLFGDWSRFLRVPNHEKYTYEFPNKYAVFRRTFFAAACYYGTREEVDLCINNLKRAYRHGFGMYYYQQTDAKRDDFPKELRQERQMLRDELGEGGAFTDQKIKSRVNTWWKFDEYPQPLSAERAEKTAPSAE